VGETTQVVFLSPGSDPPDRTDIRHEDLPVPGAVGLRAARNSFDHVRDQVIRGEHADLHLGQKIGRILSATINFSIPFLASESFNFRDRHAMHTHFHYGILAFIQLERLDEGVIILIVMPP
jgi:hypothetical protein